MHLLTTEDLLNGFRDNGTQGHLYLKELLLKQSMEKGQPFKRNSTNELEYHIRKKMDPQIIPYIKIQKRF